MTHIVTYTPERLKLVVLDANFYWSEQLFSACNDFADILLLRPRDFRIFHRQYGSYFIDTKPQPVAENIWEQRICCPPGWLFNYWFLTQIFLTSLIRKFQGNNSLVFAFCYPYYYSLAQKLKSYSIYYNFDDYSNYWHERQTETSQLEKLAVSHADLTLCTASYRANYLKKECRDQANQIVHLPHGCSPKFMVEKPLSKSQLLPPDLQQYPRPIAGYIGALTYRFDFHYLEQVAKKIPDVTIILGGSLPQPHDGSADWWRGVKAARFCANIRFIGRVPHDRLGEYLHSFDVLLMPYSRCDFNLNICPMKLWDYMGTSIPIVANNIVPEINQWSKLILVSQTPDEFAQNIRFALQNPQWRSQERWKVAQNHTWKKQAQKLYHLIEKKKSLSLQSS